nr:adenylyl cyclase-associated protein [Cryptococcus depauperatus CBS 7841]
MNGNSHGINNMNTILKRLEAVTSRLEDITVSQSSSLKISTAVTHEGLAGQVPPPPPPTPPPVPTCSAATEAINTVSPAVQAYKNEIINAALKAFLGQAKEVGGLVAEHSSLFEPLCEAQLSFLHLASNHSEPVSPAALGPLLEPQGKIIQNILESKDKFGRSKEGHDWSICFNILSEGVAAWGWVQIKPTPAPVIGEMKNATQFWCDRAFKQYKNTNSAVIAWSKSFIDLLDTLQSYVKQWHTTGVAWNQKGSPAPSTFPSRSSAPPHSPAPAVTASKPSTSTTSASGTGALLADLNRGGAVTSGLRKVDPSQMTHKNPQLRSGSTVSTDNAKRPAPPVKPKPGSFVTAKKPAKIELEAGNKWIIENQEDNKSIKIDKTELHHTVHVFGCKNSVVQICGKINAITMVGCRKTAIVLESAVSSLSITSCPSFEVQITGSIPTIQIDTTDSGQIYLSKECMKVIEIITSKTSSINISVPTGEGGDFEEKPVPEQMKTKVVDGKLITEIVEHAG